MSEHQQAHYDDGYGHHQHHNTESYYQDEDAPSYYDQNGNYAEPVHNQQQDGDGYYDELYLLLLPVD
jgi:1,3-beta-glucan synthase